MPDPADDVLARLFALFDALAGIARRMHPAHLPGLAAELAEPERALRAAAAPQGRVERTVTLVLQACEGLHKAVSADNPMLETYRAMRRYSRAQEALAGLVEMPAVSRYLLEPASRDDPRLLQRLARPPGPDTGAFHFENDIEQRGGFSVFVPPDYDPGSPAPLVMALHGGAGHGRLFLWNWLPEARTRRLIIVAPTATGGTWSLMQPDIDSGHLSDVLAQVRARWNVDAGHMLLTGMSDGGTFTLLSGVDDECPFTHLAPVAAAFHPMLLSMAEPRRLVGLPIYLVHGALDWMFPVDVARLAHRALGAAGAAVVYRELADRPHAYPRDEQGAILDWWLGR